LYRELSRGLRILYDNLTGQNIDWHMRYLEKTQWMKKKDLQRLQLKRLKTLLTYAYEKVPFYHRSFRRRDLHPADFKTLDDIRRIPVLKK
jgi:phenylacetate-CoA ligase